MLPSPYMLKYVIKRERISGRSGAYEVIFDLTDASATVKEEILTHFPEAAKTGVYFQIERNPAALPLVQLDQGDHEAQNTRTRVYYRLQLSDAEKEKFLKFWKDYNINHADEILKENGISTSSRG